MGKQEKEKSQGKEKRSLPLPVYLLYLLVCTVVLTGVSFSRYTTTTSGYDSARVAAFVVAASPNNAELSALTLTAGDTDTGTQSYGFTVSNSAQNKAAEVAMEYDVIVKLNAPLPQGVTMTLDNCVNPTVAENIYTFENVGQFQAGVPTTNSHELAFTAAETAAATSAPVTIGVSVYAEQID